jgi:hypothetical protein
MRRYVNVLGIGILLVGCAAPGARLAAFPTRGQTAEQAEQDRAACQAYAEANKNNRAALAAAGVGLLGGGAYGAATGAITGAFAGQTGTGAGYGAAIGALTGLLAGWIGGVVEERRHLDAIFAACMGARGYTVGG